MEAEVKQGRSNLKATKLDSHSSGGVVGQLVAKLFQSDPAILARRNLRRLKQLLETGEIATAARNPTLHAQGKTHE